MPQDKPRNSRSFTYRLVIGVVAFLVLVFGLYYFISKNKPLADTTSANTVPAYVGITNYTDSLKPYPQYWKCQTFVLKFASSNSAGPTGPFSSAEAVKSARQEIFDSFRTSNTQLIFYSDTNSFNQDVAKCKNKETGMCEKISRGVVKDSIKTQPNGKGCDEEKNYNVTVSAPDKIFGLTGQTTTVNNDSSNQAASSSIKINATVKDSLDKPAVGAKVFAKQASASSGTQSLSDCTTSATGECTITISDTSDLRKILSITATSNDYKLTGSATLDVKTGVSEYSASIKFGSSGGQTASQASNDTATSVDFRVVSKGIKDGSNIPINTAKVIAENSSKRLPLCTTDAKGVCSLKKSELADAIEKFREPKDTGDSYQKDINISAYKSFKDQSEKKSNAIPVNLNEPEYLLSIELDEAQAAQAVNYTAQGVPGVDNNLPILGNNAITFSAKRESNKDLVRIGAVNFELTGKTKIAKAADTKSTGRASDAANTGKEAVESAVKANSQTAQKARVSNGEPSSGARISNFLSGGALKTIKGVIPDDGSESRITIPNLPDGTYQLVLRKNFYGSATVHDIVLEGGVVQDFDTSKEVSSSGRAILLKPKANAEPPALPEGYTANKVPLSRDYLVASKGKYVSESSDNLYYSFIEPLPGWTNNILLERQIDVNDPRDRQRLDRMVSNCATQQQQGMNMGIGANVNANTLKNLGYLNAAYQIFGKPNGQSDKDSLTSALLGVGLTQILARNNQGSYNVNIDLFNKCGISPSIIRNPAYDYNYRSPQSGGSTTERIFGSLFGLLVGGQQTVNNGAYYGDKLTLQYCSSIQMTMIVENPQLTQDKMICQQRYGTQLLASSVFGNNGAYNSPYSTNYEIANQALNQYVAKEFNKLRSCAGNKIFISDAPVVFDQNTAQELVLRMKDEFDRCSADRSNFQPGAEWRDFNFLTRFGFIDSSGTRTNKLLSNAFQSFRSCAGNKISLSKAPTPNSQMAQEIFSIMVDEYKRCTADREDYTPGHEWRDVNFLSQMGFM